MSGLSRGYAESASQRLVAAKTLEQAREMQTERLSVQKELQEERIEAEALQARKGRAMQAWTVGQQTGTQRYGIEAEAKTARKGRAMEAWKTEQRNRLERERIASEEERVTMQTESQERIAAATRAEQRHKRFYECIIISACTSPDSYEVNIAREYRDNILSMQTLAGYYALCEIVVPWIHKSGLFKNMVKKALVDRLVDYGEMILGHKNHIQYKTSKIVTKLFLGLCNLIRR
jgi:hypothetical protein